MAEPTRIPIQELIGSLQRVAISHPRLMSHKGDVETMLGILGEGDDYILAIGEAPNGYLGILLGYAIAKAEGR